VAWPAIFAAGDAMVACSSRSPCPGPMAAEADRNHARLRSAARCAARAAAARADPAPLYRPGRLVAAEVTRPARPGRALRALTGPA
jgi:hypothetical protein